MWFAGRADGRSGRRRRPAAGQRSTPRRTRGVAGRSGSPCWPTARPRRAARSSTSTRSAARTSWSSTGRRWWSAPTGAVRGLGPPVRRGGARVRSRRGGRPRIRRRGPGPRVDQPPGPPGRRSAGPMAPVLDPVAEVYEALVLGTRDYLGKNGFADAVIGLSGGIDSSLVAAVAVDAIGSDHVHGVAMPSRYSSGGSVSDARGPGHQAGHRPGRRAHRSGPPGTGRHAGPAARRRADRTDRREPAEPDPRGAAHGPVQCPRLDRADDGEQERDGHRLLDAVRRLGRRLRGHQGRARRPSSTNCAATATPGPGRRSSPRRC